MHSVFNKFDSGEWQLLIYAEKDSSYDPPLLFGLSNTAESFSLCPKKINWFYKYGFNEFFWLGLEFNICLKNPLSNLVRTFTYENYKGLVAKRKVLPIFKYFGFNKWHTKPTWLLLALDLDKLKIRTFDTRKISK